MSILGRWFGKKAAVKTEPKKYFAFVYWGHRARTLKALCDRPSNHENSFLLWTEAMRDVPGLREKFTQEGWRIINSHALQTVVTNATYDEAPNVRELNKLHPAVVEVADDKEQERLPDAAGRAV